MILQLYTKTLLVFKFRAMDVPLYHPRVMHQLLFPLIQANSSKFVILTIINTTLNYKILRQQQSKRIDALQLIITISQINRNPKNQTLKNIHNRRSDHTGEEGAAAARRRPRGSLGKCKKGDVTFVLVENSGAG